MNYLHRNILHAAFALLISNCLTHPVYANSNEARTRMAEDVKQGKPLVAHVIVALCDNWSQGIIPVGNGLCDGDVPARNLYWGALYGVKTWFTKQTDWKQIKIPKPEDKRILDRIVFTRELNFQGKPATVYLVADAWQGKEIRSATQQFLELTAGSKEEIYLTENLQLNTNPHLIAYVGHNGLMDFSLPMVNTDKNFRSTSSALILACKSDFYFKGFLAKTGTHKLLTTTGLMAPEAYTLDAAITHWFSDASPTETHLAASEAYAKYQKARLGWSKTLFVFEN